MNSFVRLALILGLITGCALERSFEEEMDGDSEALFVPENDFPVVAGDSENPRRSREEIKRRAPASFREKEQSLTQNSLNKELIRLEESLSETHYSHYVQYRDRLSVSERIYLLKLRSVKERDEYLYQRGLYESPYQAAPEETMAIRNRDLIMGMSKEVVIKSWGYPHRVDVAGDPRYENERWTYQQSGKNHYVFFESGRVGGWTTQ